MQRISRVRLALVTAGVASLVLATSFAAGASATSTKGKFNAAAAKLVPASYKKVTLQVASDATYAPDESMSGANLVGFDIDLMNAVATTLGIKVKENNVTFDSIILGIASNKYQIGNSSFTDTKAREKQVNFVDYFQAGEGVYTKSSSNVKFTGLKSFCGLKVAVETGTVEQTDAQTTAKTCPANKKLSILAYTTQTEANLAVSSGHANVGFLDSQIAGYVVSTSKGAFKLVGSAVNVAPYGVATAKSAAGKGLATAIQAALKVLIANGTYAAVLSKWGVSAGALPVSKVILNGALS
jgi:polar amino acid transport system substrate-binding protein